MKRTVSHYQQFTDKNPDGHSYVDGPFLASIMNYFGTSAITIWEPTWCEDNVWSRRGDARKLANTSITYMTEPIKPLVDIANYALTSAFEHKAPCHIKLCAPEEMANSTIVDLRLLASGQYATDITALDPATLATKWTEDGFVEVKNHAEIEVWSSDRSCRHASCMLYLYRSYTWVCGKITHTNRIGLKLNLRPALYGEPSDSVHCIWDLNNNTFNH